MNTNKHIPDVTLTPLERSRMRSVVHAYMVMKPVRGAVATESTWSLAWVYSPRPVAAALVVALFASTAGVSYAASDALPGDLLYGVKTNLNEPLSGALAVSAQAKSDWAIEVASTRLQEAATLAAEGRLDTATQEELKQSFDTHAQVAADIITEQASTSPDTGVASAVSFEAQLFEYERVLTQVGDAKDVQTNTLASAVQDARTKVYNIRADAQAKAALGTSTSRSSGSLAASHMRDIARKQLKASLELAAKSGDSLDSSSVAQVAVQLNDANETIAEGQRLLDTDETPKAQGAFQNALSAAEKVGVFLKTTSAIHARTGLVVNEPEKKDTKAKNTSRTRNTSDEHPTTTAAPAATLMMTAGTSATTTEHATSSKDSEKTEINMNATNTSEAHVTTGTSGGGGSSGNAGSSGGTSGSASGSGGTSGSGSITPPSLPVSVPVQLHL